MKTNRTSAPRGTALLVSIVVLSATLMVASGALLKCSIAGYRNAANRTQRIRMLYTAEAGCQYALAYFNIYSGTYETHPGSADFERIVQQFCQIATNMFTTNLVANDMKLSQFSVEEGSVYSTNGYAPGDSVFPGMRASVKPITVKVGIQQISDPSVYVEIDQIIESRSFSIYEYGLFTDTSTKIFTDKGMTIAGAVHCNGILSLAQDGGQKLVFSNYVTCASNIYCLTDGGSVIICNGGNIGKPMIDASGAKLDSSNPFWKSQALSTWSGRVKSWVHGIPVLALPIPGAANDPRILIDPPRSNDTSAIADTRYANRAAVRILDDRVEKWTPTGYVYVTSLAACSGWATTNNTSGTASRIWDNRLNRFVYPLNINVVNFKDWANANVSTPFNTDPTVGGTLYVFRTNQHPLYSVVKLWNGASIPRTIIGGTTNGFSVFTGLPLYIQGDYNSDTAVPAATMADACTVLSAAWKDSEHSVSGSPITKVANTKFFTAIVAGQCTNLDQTVGTFEPVGDGWNVVPGESGVFYGGIEDLPGYIEDWQGTGASGNKEIRGTIASFFTSKWQSNVLIDPECSPNRFWRYDPNFAYPINTPRFYEFAPTRWIRVATNSMASL